jgi:hypothetical protein
MLSQIPQNTLIEKINIIMKEINVINKISNIQLKESNVEKLVKLHADHTFPETLRQSKLVKSKTTRT